MGPKYHVQTTSFFFFLPTPNISFETWFLVALKRACWVYTHMVKTLFNNAQVKVSLFWYFWWPWKGPVVGGPEKGLLLLLHFEKRKCCLHSFSDITLRSILFLESLRLSSHLAFWRTASNAKSMVELRRLLCATYIYRLVRVEMQSTPFIYIPIG